MAQYRILWNANQEIDRLRDKLQERAWECWLLGDIADAAQPVIQALSASEGSIHVVPMPKIHALKQALQRYDRYKNEKGYPCGQD